MEDERRIPMTVEMFNYEEEDRGRETGGRKERKGGRKEKMGGRKEKKGERKQIKGENEERKKTRFFFQKMI